MGLQRSKGVLNGTGEMPRKFPLELLQRITDNFSKSHEIGEGTYGVVYKGKFEDKEIAVKKLHNQLGLIDDQFNECINLMRVEHPNVVRLIGYCFEIEKRVTEYNGKLVFADVEERALCLEYMEGGSLEHHISEEPCQLDWCKCYEIIKGISKGLYYLHTGLRNPIFHLDLKPANILLDKDKIPKIGDFGLSRLGSTKTRATEKLIGTFGYMPPEYIDNKEITPKFDVFSLGIIILQIMAGRTGCSQRTDMPYGEFIKTVHEHWVKRIQTTMLSDASWEVNTCIEIALKCVENDRANRPTIAEIITLLKINTPKSSSKCQINDFQSEQDSDEQYASLGQRQAPTPTDDGDLGAGAHDPSGHIKTGCPEQQRPGPEASGGRKHQPCDQAETFTSSSGGLSGLTSISKIGILRTNQYLIRLAIWLTITVVLTVIMFFALDYNIISEDQGVSLCMPIIYIWLICGGIWLGIPMALIVVIVRGSCFIVVPWVKFIHKTIVRSWLRLSICLGEAVVLACILFLVFNFDFVPTLKAILLLMLIYYLGNTFGYTMGSAVFMLLVLCFQSWLVLWSMHDHPGGYYSSLSTW